jgi:hypothetical protein
VSLTSLLDTVADAGQALARSADGDRERADRLLLPIWRWLQEVAIVSQEFGVEWTTVDGSLSASDQAAISAKVQALLLSLDSSDDRDVDVALAELRDVFTEGIDRAQANLRDEGLEAHVVATLFLPIRSEMASWTYREESDEVLTRARSALTAVGATRLALSFNDQFAEDLRQANRFRYGAMAFFVLAVAWAVAAYATLPESVTASSLAGRGAIGVSLVVIGGFLTREANHHRTDANVWRTVQLQLNAIEAYCADMPRANAEALKFMLGAAVFSGPRLYSAAAGHRARDGVENGNGARTQEASLDASVQEILAILREVGRSSSAARSGRSVP